METVLVALLWRRGAFRVFPLFFVYFLWSIPVDVFFLWFRSRPAAHWLYRDQVVIDATLITCIIIELTWNLLRPLHEYLPKYSWIVLVVLVLAASGILWPITGFMVPEHLSRAHTTIFQIEQTAALLRVVCFLGLAGFSELLCINWQDRELQIATGLGVYSLVSLASYFIHSHQDPVADKTAYYWIDVVVSISYGLALTYWVVAFAKAERERQNFTPAMQDFLLKIAGVSKAQRLALQNARTK